MKLEEYFDFKFWIDENNIPKYKVKLKNEYINGKPYPKNSNGMPLSPSKVDYYHYFLGEEIGSIVYEFAKCFFNKKYAFTYALNNKLIDKSMLLLINNYFENINEKMKKNHSIVMKLPEYREKLKLASNKELQSNLKKEWYKNEINKNKMQKALNSPESINKRIESYKNWVSSGGREILIIAANKPDRKLQIAESAKLMWKKAIKENDYEKLNKWYKSRFSRNYNLLEYKMNKIEYEFGLLLINLQLEFDYEPILKLNNRIIYPDFLIPNNIIFECYGDFWHGNPKFYNSTDNLFCKTTAKEIWEKDKQRIELLAVNGYKTFYFWENDILFNKQLVKEKIKEAINGII